MNDKKLLLLMIAP